MTWLLEVYAAAYAGFGFLANNYVDCSATQIFQMVLIATAAGGAAWIMLRSVANERLRRRLMPVDGCEPRIAAALERARRVVGLKRPIACYWIDDSGFQLAVLGYFRPSLIIGRDVAGALCREELEAALAHELMHVRRRDALRVDLGRLLFALLSLAAIFALTLFLVFYLGAFAMDRLLAGSIAACSLVLAGVGGQVLVRQLERNAEFACDSAAAAGEGGALATAAALVKVAQLQKGLDRKGLAAAVTLFSAETFRLRVSRLIDTGTGSIPPERQWRRRAGTALLALSIALAAQPPNLKSAAEGGCRTCGLVLEKSARWADA